MNRKLEEEIEKSKLESPEKRYDVRFVKYIILVLILFYAIIGLIGHAPKIIAWFIK
jgi:hypothetical protein